MKIEEEIWKNIEGYEGLYQVSDKGRIKSIGYRKEKILKPKINNCGYLQVNLWKNGEYKWCLIHRLVAMAFIPNPNDFPQVNHRDENPSNNNIENLEWCNRKYNMTYGTRIQRFVEKISKSVLQYTKDGKIIKEWKSAKDVERNLGYAQNSISLCCRGKLKTAYGFVWKFKKEKKTEN